MERLDLTTKPYGADVEAAIHIARYAIAKSLVKGKKVLDIACGEGYGSFLLKQAGAEKVVGVDISEEAIQYAQKTFGGNGIDFRVADATTIAEVISDGSYDVVVSLETIEHVADPEKFLQSIKKLARPDAIFIITCPNDHWYYPTDAQSNPYHIKKYTFDEFQRLTTPVLGENVRWSIGSAVFGFGTTPSTVNNSYTSMPGTWINYVEAESAYLVSAESTPLVMPSNCSYFIGIWNSPTDVSGLGVSPIDMGAWKFMMHAQDDWRAIYQQDNEALRAENHALRQQLNLAQPETEIHARKVRHMGLQLAAAQAENDLMREGISTLQNENRLVSEKASALQVESDLLRINHNRYVWLRGLIPRPVRSLLFQCIKTACLLTGKKV